METIYVRDFSAGWCPSDDQDNGRQNGLTEMDSVELDQNGALVLTCGTRAWSDIAFSVPATNLYSAFINGIRRQYVATNDGNVTRINPAQVVLTGGSLSRAAFFSLFDYIFIFSGVKRVRDTGTSTENMGVLAPPAAPDLTDHGSGQLTGTYSYVQVNVKTNGSGYQAISAFGIISTISVTNSSVDVQPNLIGPTADKVWIFRKGGQINDVWYLVSESQVLFNDNMTDVEIEERGVIGNPFVQPTTYPDLPDTIIEVVGPINGRAVMFSGSKIFFSLPYAPDSYDPRTTINLSGNQNTGSEAFLFAKQINQNSIIIGTTARFYVLTGTFQSYPDGSLDISLQPIGTEFPPVGTSASIYNGQVVYMAKQGWRILSIDGGSVSLVSPNLDSLYRGLTRYSYGGIPTFVFPTLNYQCTIAKDKLWVIVPTITNNDPNQAFSSRIDVYDFVRKSWRTMPYPLATALTTEPDGAVTMFAGLFTSYHLFQLDHPPFANENGKLIDLGGSAGFNSQLFKVGWTFRDNNTGRTRKDGLTFSLLVNTFGADVTIVITPNSGTAAFTKTINTTSLQVTQFDISNMFNEFSFRVEMTGLVPDFELKWWSLDFEPHPPLMTSISLISQNWTPNKKRGRVWPFVLDTLGNDVIFQPQIDGANEAQSVFNSSSKKTFFHYFKTDVFGIDYTGTLICPNGSFEVWQIGDVNYVETLPIAKRFDQVGPNELYRYAKVRYFQIRLIAFNGSDIPFQIYADDVLIPEGTGTISITSGQHQVAEISVPKKVVGSVIRLTLGPTSFDFHRIYTRIGYDVSGGGSDDIKWQILEAG